MNAAIERIHRGDSVSPTELQQIEICSRSGLLATDKCYDTVKSADGETVTSHDLHGDRNVRPGANRILHRAWRSESRLVRDLPARDFPRASLAVDPTQVSPVAAKGAVLLAENDPYNAVGSTEKPKPIETPPENGQTAETAPENGMPDPTKPVLESSAGRACTRATRRSPTRRASTSDGPGPRRFDSEKHSPRGTQSGRRLMAPAVSGSFRLTVLNPGGHDPEQQFPDGAGDIGPQHAPVNFHAFAACTGGSFQREVRRAIAEKTPVLLLLRGDFKASERAFAQLKKTGCPVVVSLKETGLHQIAQQLRDPGPLARFKKLIAAADGCIGITPEAADVYRSLRTNPDRVAFIPTPYPVGDSRWDFSRPASGRSGIFVGTREFNVPSRNHLATMLLAQSLSERTNEHVTVFNANGRSGEKLLAALNFPAKRLNIIRRKLHYPDYLREVSRHKLVLQLDTSFVPGQVAGDALLCGLPCVGGNGAIDRIAFEDICGVGGQSRKSEESPSV